CEGISFKSPRRIAAPAQAQGHPAKKRGLDEPGTGGVPGHFSSKRKISDFSGACETAPAHSRSVKARIGCFVKGGDGAGGIGLDTRSSPGTLCAHKSFVTPAGQRS